MATIGTKYKLKNGLKTFTATVTDIVKKGRVHTVHFKFRDGNKVEKAQASKTVFNSMIVSTLS